MAATQTVSTPAWNPEDPSDTSFEMVFGGMFDPFAPEADKIDLDTISLVLSNNCRFNGHVLEFYSIAQHSVLVAHLAPHDLAAQEMALLHDADEVFGIPDLITQVKKEFPNIKAVQAAIGAAIEERFNLDAASHLRIKPADRQALLLEKDRLKTKVDASHWKSWSAGLEVPEGITIDPLPPRAARALYQDAIKRVFEERLAIDADWLAGEPGFTLQADPIPTP